MQPGIQTMAECADPFREAQAKYDEGYASQIRKWLQSCTGNHSDACKRPGSSILPKRLIFLDEGSDTEYLVPCDGLIHSPEYIALSYCWGLKGNFKTTLDNLRQMERTIRRDQLPRTLADVFRMARLLNFRYIWVDALCIVQDGLEFKSEIVKMGDVYANASLVLAAMASESVHDGLFVGMGDHHTQDLEDKHHQVMRTCRTMTQREWYGLRKAFPLLCRGWAFQERLLARRIVHFTRMELVWECLGDRWCQCMDGKGLSGGTVGKINNMNSALRQCRATGDPAAIRQMWRECVKSFSKRDLTNLEDRLYAVNGIASYLNYPDTSPCYEQEQYHHGLRKDALPWDLMWYCDQSSLMKSQKSDRSPSFSWASVDYGIEWFACNHWTPTEKFSLAISTGTCLEFGSEAQYSSNDVHVCKVISVNASSIILDTRIMPATVKKGHTKAQHQTCETPSWAVEIGKAGDIQTLPFYPDIDWVYNEDEEGRALQFVEIASCKDSSTIRQGGLIVRLKPMGAMEASQEFYERVGVTGDISCNSENRNLKWITGQSRRITLV